jgi:hypothetical protein
MQYYVTLVNPASICCRRQEKSLFQGLKRKTFKPEAAKTMLPESGQKDDAQVSRQAASGLCSPANLKKGFYLDLLCYTR